MRIEIYTDGSCLGNGKSNSYGGYGVVVLIGDKVMKVAKTYSKGFRDTTNNAMELEGMIKAIEVAKVLRKATFSPSVEIFCDSAYVVNTVNTWMYNWANKGWIKSDKKPPENLDLVKKLYDLMSFEQGITITKVKGHADNEFNNMADALAVSASNLIKERDF